MATGGDDDPIASRASSAEPKRRRLVRKKDTSSKEATPDVQVVSVKPAPPKPARFQEDSGDETDVDDGPTTSYGETALDRKTVDFFNTATPQQMTEAMTVCTAAQADFIVGLRPFRSMGHLEESLTGHKGNRPLAKLPEKYQEIQEGYNEVDALIEKCERYGDEVMSILREWTHAPPDAPVGEKVDEDGDAPEISLTHIDATADSDSDSDVTTRPQQSSLASTNPPKPARWKCLKSQPALINPALTLKSYQLVGVSWLYMLHGKGLGGILADEMGLGKTAQVISFLALLKQHGHQTRHLIVVPTSTLENWLREFARWCPNLVVRPYHGSQNERYGLQEQYMDEVDGIDVFVTTYTLATGQKPDRAFLRRLNCTSLILDEGHMVKNMESARYKHLMSFKTPFRLLLTGTPLQNNLMELLALLTFIMPRLFANVDAFGKIFNVKNSGENGFLSRQRIERAKKIMAPFVLRRKKRQVLKELPAKTVKIELCTPTETQKMLYEGIIAESRKSLLAQAEEAAAAAAAEKQAESSPAPPTKPKALQRQTPAFGQRQLSNVLMQLRKAADHPLLFRTLYTNTHLRTLAREIMREDEYIDASREYIYEDMTVMSDFELHNLCGRFKGMKKHCLAEESWMDAGKVEWLKRNLLVMRDRGDRILVFSQFVMMLDVLEAVLGTMGVRYVRMDGRTNIVERQTRIDEFNENPDITVFLLSTKAGGFGINLTSANVVIIYDMDFNPHNDAQAEDRAHRVGQTRDVTVYKLVLDNSIEQHILKNAQTKLKLDERVQEGEQQHQQPHVVFDGEGGKGKGKETDSDTAEGAEGGKEDEAAEIADVGFLEMLRNELVAGS
ncbi:SNF2 family N-terminal domain-containing protein [Fimicolochytrium jonesii]|uniref:SNF2 family N-terminal domain-containing protein n=1 Tax=Fimicolochytrium jonesii TaxID=1396493 RepID=UPI0022FE387F|nr:SNF2 family N-terminal domain-containing protein [Fimicolochytrium jonesii]KAI8822380.1 SNF2 family N-terminal domain-containing protein [Fimicolochytrium jonesii]